MTEKMPIARLADADWFHLWFQFLLRSPSYELARRFMAGEAGLDLPADFEAVLRVFDDFGDVQGVQFRHWWRDVGFHHFGWEGEKPKLTRLGVIAFDDVDDRLARMRSSVRDYLDEEWLDQAQPTTIIAAIPVGVPKAQIMKQLSGMIDAVTNDERDSGRKLAKPSTSYALARTGKLHRPSVWKYLRCLMIKAQQPELPLWGIGLKAKLSSTYSGMLDPQNPPPKHKEADYKNSLKILTSRALLRGHMIAENAARGLFPSYAKCEHALPVDYEFIRKVRVGRFVR